MAKATGIPRSTISTYRNGGIPTLEAALEIANHLSISISALAGEHRAVPLDTNVFALYEVKPAKNGNGWTRGRWLCSVHGSVFPTLRAEKETSVMMWRATNSCVSPILLGGEWTMIDTAQISPHEKGELFLISRDGKLTCRRIAMDKFRHFSIWQYTRNKAQVLNSEDFDAHVKIVGKVLATVKWIPEATE